MSTVLYNLSTGILINRLIKKPYVGVFVIIIDVHVMYVKHGAYYLRILKYMHLHEYLYLYLNVFTF